MKTNEHGHLGKSILEIEGAPQKKGGLFGRKTKSLITFYEEGVVIEMLGNSTEILKKDIENIYYTVPNVGGHDCITTRIDFYNGDMLNICTFDETTWHGIFDRVDRLLDNEWNEFRKPKTEVPDKVRWFNAASAIITLVSEADVDIFGGYVKSPDGAETAATSLGNSWKVNKREDLLERLDLLLSECSGEQAGKTTVGWNMVRLIRIASLGYLAGYITFDEALEYCSRAGIIMQSVFGGWDEMFAGYMQGYIDWSGEDPKDEESKAYQRLAIYAWLKTFPKSPYRIDWNTNLESKPEKSKEELSDDLKQKIELSRLSYDLAVKIEAQLNEMFEIRDLRVACSIGEVITIAIDGFVKDEETKQNAADSLSMFDGAKVTNNLIIV